MKHSITFVCPAFYKLLHTKMIMISIYVFSLNKTKIIMEHDEDQPNVFLALAVLFAPVFDLWLQSLA